ncbi:MAG: DUF6625 family protein [Bacteroidales bacterium]
MNLRILIVHFGPWPSWIPYFLQTCGWNSRIDWLIFTDQPLPRNCPPHVIMHQISLQAFGEILSSHFNISVSIHNPYKICDYRPAFGEIFKQWLNGYDYWGYSDLDLVYGNVFPFIEPHMKRKTDIIGVREQYLAGHFALFRNTPEISSLYKLYPHYLQVFSDTRHHYGFDEKSSLIGKKLKHPGETHLRHLCSRLLEKPIRKIKFKKASISAGENRDLDQISKNMARQGKISLFRKDMVRSDLWYRKKHIPDWEIVWKNGKLIDKKTDEELLHFHFIKSKNTKWFHPEPWRENSGFRINRKGIHIQE